MKSMQYFQIADNLELPETAELAPFKAVLAVEDSVDEQRRTEIAVWLVDSGCKYVMLCGEDCDDWEQSIRQANLARMDLDDMRPEQFVMITSHQHDRLRNVFWHAKKHANHSHVKFENLLTIHLGKQNRSVEYQSIFHKA